VSALANPPVLLLTGAPGVGKTTVARVLAEGANRAAHIESDRFFHFIEPGLIEPWKPDSHDQNTVVMQAVAQAAVAYAGGGYLTIVDGIILPAWFLEPMRTAVRGAGQGVAYGVLRAPLDLCLARARDREARPAADADVVERLWREFADLGAWERHAIDIDELSPDDAAGVVMRRLEEGSLLA
jgi:tRNA uridine 5-carbamoylmethylation protein Kti12